MAALLSPPRSCCPLLLSVIFFPSLFLHCQIAADDYLDVVYINCSLNVTSLTTAFSLNLDTALRNLTTLSSHGFKYANTTTGSGAGIVYAMFQCRGDQSLQQCWDCMQNATARLPQRDCPHSVGARIQLDGCFLRYENNSFFVLDTSLIIWLCSPYKTSDTVALRAIADVVDNVTSLAPQQGGFASASKNGEHAAAQCLGYLSDADCSQCLLICNGYRSGCNSTLGGRTLLPSCYIRYEAYVFLAPLPPPPAAAPALALAPAPLVRTLQPPLQSALSAPKSSGSKTAIIAVGVVVGVIIGTAILCATLAWRYKASRVKGEKWVDKAASWPRQLLQTKAQVFSLEELEEATAQFHPTTKLGEGGYGVVYKGTLLSGEQVAIKKLSVRRQEGNQEFLNEVNLITSVQHKNLIRLLGCCLEGPERILVYEYLPNKSLDDFIFGEGRMLDWSTRFGIIFGTAKGLAYLHEESHVRIIHRDIKPSNILLDEGLNPVIADFGLARLVKENATHVNTRVAGTMGYVAPEYAICGDLSEKVDVYSFGLLSLEIITGLNNLHSSLLKLVWEHHQQGKALDLLDEKLGNSFSPEQGMRVVQVSLLCTQENPKQRPAMSMVTLWLSGTSAILEEPLRPSYLNYSETVAPTHGVNHQFASGSSGSSQSTHAGGIAARVQSLSGIVEPR